MSRIPNTGKNSENLFRYVCRTTFFLFFRNPTWTRSPAATSPLLLSSSSTSHSSGSVAVAVAPAVVVAPRQQRLTPLTPPDADSDSPAAAAADETSAWPAAPGIGIRGLLWCSSRLGNPPPPDSMEGPPPSPPPPDSMEGRREKPAGEGVRGERGGVTRSSGGQRVDIMVRLLGCRSCKSTKWMRSSREAVLRIRYPEPFWPLDPGSGMGKKSASGSGIRLNNPDHIF